MKKLILFLLLVFLMPVIEPQIVSAGERRKSNSAKKAEKKRKKNCRRAYQAYKPDRKWAPEPKYR